MALPKINQPLFSLTIPSTKAKIKYRPFTVKEEKILLIAQESGDSDQTVLAIKQIINNCIEDINVEELATFDLEYIMLQLRAKSVSDVIEIKITDPDTKEEIDLSIDLNTIQIKENKDHDPFIKIQDDMVLHMTYPTLLMMNIIDESDDMTDPKVLFKLMISCMKEVIQGDDVYPFKDFSHGEIEEFVNSMSMGNMNDIKMFFETMPVLKYEKEYTRKDGTKKTFVVQGMDTFFL